MAVKGNAIGKGWDGIGTNMGNEKVDERNVHFCFALLSMCIHDVRILDGKRRGATHITTAAADYRRR